ncbi:40S ribosomal protein S23 [Blastocystis sp. subtype 4]|uniref:40S ribosomal protein S23 n=1 Tax=Blastocystis sp. subtype 4 TaxID=944170 RepID=UPI000711ECBE|nr:40S ribosomal protein S23 [Blastocystis sp. subtype 4]KNB42608.1 40S ribosomal protein S23 [Blastocystis sp. subtype 4]|eukprot:XP_014526051.1 40S ribosomal protein S23 [Blastocystis sp. subtype 4]
MPYIKILLIHFYISSIPGKTLWYSRKLRVVRRNERWADKTYKKGHNISSIKANVLGGATMAKGIVLEKV